MIITNNNNTNNNNAIRDQEELFVFGYGSLVWKPDFECDKKFIACLPGYERRCWQSSKHHRGTAERPGRCVTLVPVKGGKCWGVVFHVTGRENVRNVYDNLYVREQSIGCYDLKVLPVIPKENLNNGQPIMAVVYYATPNNPLYMEDTDEKTAKCIATTRGVAGHSIEYLFKITDFMRENLPNECEPHLYKIDRLVSERIGLSQTNRLPWNILIQCDKFKQIMEGSRSYYHNHNQGAFTELDHLQAITVVS